MSLPSEYCPNKAKFEKQFPFGKKISDTENPELYIPETQ